MFSSNGFNQGFSYPHDPMNEGFTNPPVFSGFDPFLVLGVSKFYGVGDGKRPCNNKDVETAFHTLSRQYHPDKTSSLPEEEKKVVETKYKDICKAYDMIKDEASRTRVMLGFMQEPSIPEPPINEAPRGMFGNNSAHLSTSVYRNFQEKKPPIRKQVECTLEELFKGCYKHLEFEKKVYDPDQGQIVDQTHFLPVEIKPGWHDGYIIFFKNNNVDQKLIDMLGGDVDIECAIKQLPHPIFQQDGVHLSAIVEIEWWESLLGVQRTLKGVDAQDINITTSQPFWGNFTLTIPQQGMLYPERKNQDGTFTPQLNPNGTLKRGELKVELVVKSIHLTKEHVTWLREKFTQPSLTFPSFVLLPDQTLNFDPPKKDNPFLSKSQLFSFMQNNDTSETL